MNPETWDERYSAEEYVYGKEPNDYFKKVIDSMNSGKLLLPGDGEGRNAVYAAQRGWTVDAFDISQNAATKALRLAKEKSVRISFQVDNFLFFQPKTDFYNLVAVLFLHIPRNQRRIFSVKLWDSLRPGGKLIMEVFSKEQLKYNSGGPKNSELLYSEQEILADFPCFKPEHLGTVERDLKEGQLHKGRASVIRYIGIK
jgi:SAM-dependent methyltransferase